MVNPNTPAFWDEKIQATKWISSEDHITKDRIRYVASLIPNSSINLLDIGLGYGFLEKQLIKKEKINVFGVDISFIAVKRASNSYGRKFIVANILNLPFKKDFFDSVCILEVLEHLDEDETNIAYKEILRILRKGGKLIISVPLYDRVFAGHPSGHVRTYNPELLKEELTKSKLIIMKHRYFSAFKNNYFVKNALNRILKVRKPNIMVVLARKT